VDALAKNVTKSVGSPADFNSNSWLIPMQCREHLTLRRPRICGIIFGFAACAALANSAAGQAARPGGEPPSIAPQPPPDGSWTADAVIESALAVTDLGLGAAQGVVVRDGKVYAYGDVVMAKPRVGVIREYDTGLKATGRVVWLKKGNEPLILHPTGLTWDARFGTFLGDTVKKKAIIYRFDWEQAWKDGNLDHAVLDIIDDDAAINGCRPTFVSVGGKPFLATADYGDIHNEIRLYDPATLLAAKRSSAPGVVVHRVLCGPFNQNLYWDAEDGRIVCVQNVIEGRGWRLDEIDLSKAVADGRASAPGVRLRTLTFPEHDELEGYWPLDADRGLFTAARRKNNVLIGTIRRTEPKLSPPPQRAGPDR
jgi:hypothetical protein